MFCCHLSATAERDRTSISRERPKGKERPREGDAQGGREKVRVKQRSRPDGAERETGQKAARAHARRSTGGDVARKQVRAATCSYLFHPHSACSYIFSPILGASVVRSLPHDIY